MGSKGEFLRKYTSKYIHLVPEFLKENDSFLVFLALLCHEFNITDRNIESFTDLIDPDKVPKEFLEYLGSYFDYHYQGRATTDFNRELLMRNRKLYEGRGNKHSIVMAATHGNNEGYLGGDIFIPGYKISRDLAEMSIARESIFIHSDSKFSSSSLYQDGSTYRQGVILILLSSMDSSIMAKLMEVIPAGIRLRWGILLGFSPNEVDLPDPLNYDPPTGTLVGVYGTLSYGAYMRPVAISDPYLFPFKVKDRKLSVNNPLDVFLDITLHVKFSSERNILIFSDGTKDKDRYFDHNGKFIPILDESGNILYPSLVHGKKLRSGSLTEITAISDWIEDDSIIESNLGVSALPLSLVRRPFNLSSFPNIAGVSSDNSELDDRYFKITPTGEYEDRIDKLTADSVLRNMMVKAPLEQERKMYHHVRKRSTKSARHSGTLVFSSGRLLYMLLCTGVEFDDGETISSILPWIDEIQDSNVKEEVIEDLDKILFDDIGIVLENNLDGTVDVSQSRVKDGSLSDLIKSYSVGFFTLNELQKEHDSVSEFSPERDELERRIFEIALNTSNILKKIRPIKEEISERVGNILESIAGESSSAIENFNNIWKYYYDNNYFFSGVCDEGDIFEYVSVQTMQPGDSLYPISEVLDYKPSDSLYGSLKTWNETYDRPSQSLKPYGENRNPFYTYPFDVVQS